MTGTPDRRLTLPRLKRLTGARQFERVRAARTSKRIDPLTVFAAPNALDYSRLGLAISRRVGRATARIRLKRLLREAFRLSQHELPAGYDFLISVRAHQPLVLAEYRERLSRAACALHQRWLKRTANERPI